MKKLFLSIILFSFCFTVNAQFGAAVGYESSKVNNTSTLPFDSSTSEPLGSFSIGLFYESEISNKFDLLSSFDFSIGQYLPELFVDDGLLRVGDDENNTSIAIGLDLQYYPMGKDGGLFIQPGLGLGYRLGVIDSYLNNETSLTGFIGIGFDLSEKFTVIGSYGTSFSDSNNTSEITSKRSGFGISLLYKFKFRNK